MRDHRRQPIGRVPRFPRRLVTNRWTRRRRADPATAPRTPGRIAAAPVVAGRARSVLVAVALLATVGVLSPSPATASTGDDDWLRIVNTYRAMSGLAPLAENPTWSAQASEHSCYMLQNGITHDQQPGAPGHTEGGAIAGRNGNVAVSSSAASTARTHIDLWMTGPFHAIGLLRHNLTTTGYGQCNRADSATAWRSAATLDVIRGIDPNRPRPAKPVVFPGDGATVPLDRFKTESPDPVAMCGWSGSAGLPLIAMMPNAVTSATASIRGPNGTLEVCVLHPGNVAAGTKAHSIVDSENAVVVVPRQVFANGAYQASVTSNGGTATWSFTVDTSAPLAHPPKAPIDLPDTAPTAAPASFEPVEPFRLVDTRKRVGATRLRAGHVVQIDAAQEGVAAVSANFVAVAPSAPGHLTVFDCGDKVPGVSTLGYAPGSTIANQAIVPLRDGRFCMTSHADVDVVVDINGFYRSGGAAFRPVTPARLYDSRTGSGGRLAAGVERQIRVAGAPGGAPADAAAVALNVTAINGADDGHLQVYPCGSRGALETSTINYAAGEIRPNTVVMSTDGAGQVCVRSIRPVDIAVDVTGYFAVGSGLEFTALAPIRLFDSRWSDRKINATTAGRRVEAGQVVRVPIAGVRGVPAEATAASVNLTVTGSTESLHATAYPCGTRPNTSNLNAAAGQTAANGALVKLSGTGELCIYVLREAHLIVDINGVYR